MVEKTDEALIIATQFSKLRSDSATVADLEYEAVTALSEAMDLLASALTDYSEGKAWNDPRHERLKERSSALAHALESRAKEKDSQA